MACRVGCDPDGNGVHGLNERKSVQGLYEERDYLFELIQAYARTANRRPAQGHLARR